MKSTVQRRRFIAAVNLQSPQLIVIGSSAGGISLLKQLFLSLPPTFSVPVVVVQHFGSPRGESLATFFSEFTSKSVKEVEDKEKISSNTIYFAPADYHVLVSKEKKLHLSVDAPVYYCRPSIDILFESAAVVYQQNLLAVILTGANEDGAKGVEKVKKCGGKVAIQSVVDAEYSTMPAEAFNRVPDPDFSGTAQEIFGLISNIEVGHTT